MGAGRNSSSKKTGAPRFDLARLERRMFCGPGSLLRRNSYCDALAYYYLRNPLPYEMPSPKPLIPPPWKLEIVASDISYASLRAGQEGAYTETQMEPVDYTCRLRYFEKHRRKIRRQKPAQRSHPVRLSQFEDRILAAPQRHHPVPQRNDLFRRSRTKASDRQVLALLESRRLFVRRATPKAFSASPRNSEWCTRTTAPRTKSWRAIS